MPDAVTAVLPIAVLAAVSPLPILAQIVLLLTPRAVVNGVAFAAGWVLTFAVASGVTAVLLGSGAQLGGGARAGRAAEVLLGLLFLLLAAYQWPRRRHGGTSAPVLGWLAAADRLRPRRAIGLAAVLVLANPKILVLTAAAAAAVTVESTSSAQDIAGFATYVVVGSFGVAIPLAARMALGERASRQLESWRTWLIAHGALLTVAILTVLGIALIARGLR